jgi:hypothetical protein
MQILGNFINRHLIFGGDYYVVLGFFTLRARKQFTEARNGKFYLLIFPNKVVSGTCPTQRPFCYSSHIQCMRTLHIFGIEPILYRCGFKRTDPFSLSIRHQLHLRFLSPIILLLRNVRKLVSTACLLGPLFFHGKGVVFAVFFLSFTVFVAKYLTTLHFLTCW